MQALQVLTHRQFRKDMPLPEESFWFYLLKAERVAERFG